jgi:acetyl esterase/lipase
LAWVRANADEHGIDPNFVVVTGGSAGGHLTALMALTSDDLSLQPGFEDVDCTVQAAVPFYGVYDFTNRLGAEMEEMRTWVLEPMVMKAFYDDAPELFEAASPIDRVHPAAPPFFVLHGSKDTLAPVEDAREFVSRLGATSQEPVFYAELEGAQHAFDIFSSPRTRRALDGVQRFLHQVHADYLADQQAPVATESAPASAPPAAENEVKGAVNAR